MATRIRTLNFLPEIFKTPTNSQFLSATLDQLVAQPNTKKIEGYIGSKFGYGVNAKDKYVVEPTKTRTDYQLAPGVTFLKKDTSTAQDFISYPGIIDGLELEGGIVNDNNRLFTSQFYSWDSFTNLDKIINFNQYYWLPEGPDAVTVSTETVYNATDYTITSLSNGYLVVAEGASQGSVNPTLTLLRGGTYRFSVNQNSGFWIQGQPGVTGYDPTQPNVQTREVLGVDNNGAEVGVVEFTVPYKNAQDEYNFPGNNRVDVVSSLPYDQVNGVLVSSLTNGIDGITSLEGLTLMFYGNFDVNATSIVVGNTYKIYTLGDTDWNVVADTTGITYAVGDIIEAINIGTGTGTVVPMGYISKFYDTTSYDEDGGTPGYTPPGTDADYPNYDGGYYTDIASTFYTITYEGNPADPVIRLIEASTIPVEEKITANYGTEFIGRSFYLNTSDTIVLIPYLSAILDTLYYQDGTSSNKVGQIKLIASNNTNRINILTDVIGKANYTSPNGVVFTNGLKVTFSGDIYPSSYENVQYYVEGVGTAIELVPVSTLIAPEPFTSGSYIPFDTLPYDIGNYDSSLYVPVTPDYITIARNSIDKNPWSRSNRWFHIDVINATATYNNNPESVSVYATAENKAKRPIIEFYPNLRLFDTGVVGKDPIDFIDFRTTNAFTTVVNQQDYYPDVEVYTAYTATINAASSTTSTTIDINTSDITGTFQVGQYITDLIIDSASKLPSTTQITNISTALGVTTLTVAWDGAVSFASTAVASLIANDQQNDEYALFDGARVVFAADTNTDVKNKIYVVRFNSIEEGSAQVITLTEATDGLVLPDEQTFTFRGYNYKGEDFYFDGLDWILGQQKTTVNQPPLFDIFDENNISFGDSSVYVGTSFAGNKLFAYGLGSGMDDAILGFPLRYSSVDNVGDISFDVSLNLDTFNYVSGTSPITQKVNTGYVYNYSDVTTYVRQLGWQTAVAPSVQYQIFEFNYYAANPTTTYTCDIAKLAESAWPTIQLYVNNILQPSSDYTVTTTDTQTIVEFSVPEPLIDTVIEILLLSDQVSPTAYYSVPINLNNNPLNEDITNVNVGDIRGQYQSIFYNNPNTTGVVFGANNYRDLGNVVPYGNAIIQNSASLVLPGSFLRKQNHNLFNALLFNSREYITFKSLLVDTVNNTDYEVMLSPAVMLDGALDKITASKTDSNSFFWSDMLPSKAAYITNTYSFANALDTSIYPLSHVYNFATANYNSVLVYLTTASGTITQLIRNTDYTISTDSPSLTVTLSLAAGDQITIKEYNQTYGSYVPNTPTKLGLYPATIPSVTLDSNYNEPTYFIVGHDGSYTKLYGDYIDGKLIDFRDQVLLEFETRIYNNLKLSNTIPIQAYEVLPGFFRDTDYSYDEILQIYSSSFLNWVGQNRISYKKQFYSVNNEFSYNYNLSGNKINNQVIPQGYWRGIYEYFYDTSTPESTPWEMLGYKNMPTWWATRYGAAPYTSDNLVLWGDLAQGIDWNNGNPVVITAAIRPQLLQVLPVDSAGNLVSPFNAIVGNYSNTSFNRDWKVGDVGPAEFSYRRSSSWPFDLMRILALTKPAEFFNLGVDIDNYKYNEEFNQYLVNNRSHLVISDVEIYGNGIAKTSYINWIVDYEKQVGIDATTNITTLLDNVDVRLVYRLAGFSDKNLLKFYVEKSTANSNNSSLLIPDESYQVLLYDNQPFDRIVYSGVVIQLNENGYYKVYGNSQTNAYFNVLLPKINGNYERVSVQGLSVQLAKDYYDTPTVVAYGTEFYSVQEVAQFLDSYGRYLASQGVLFDQIESGLEVSWRQMVAEYLYWAQSGWEVGSIVNINPAATLISINKDSYIVQPLTLQQQNFVLNQNLYPIQSVDLNIVRDGTLFTAQPLNVGDTVAYGQFNISNFEHGIVFDNVTLFDDVIYNLVTGLRQNRITVRGTKTADWNGTIDAQGFILNQDNIQEWNKEVKYTTGSIVKYKNKYWIAIKIIQAKTVFDERDWKETDYNEIQKGLLPNTSTRSYESTLYYDVNQTNLENDADLLSFSLIGYRPRDYLALADLTDITQINVYKNFIKNKGTLNAVSAFKGANLPQGGIDYEVYENWAIKSGEFGGVLNSNFIDFKLNENNLTGNPSIVGLTNGVYTEGVQQEVPLYSIYNYGRPVTNTNILPTLPTDTPTQLFPDAGYANFDDMRIAAYYYYNLANSTSPSGVVTPISKLYVGQYVWIANYQGTWQVMTPVSLGAVIFAKNNLNGTVTITFNNPHNLSKYQPFAVVNFSDVLNGYYVANTVIDTYSILVNVTLDPSITTITGQGIGFRFQSQRVANPSDIIDLPLLNNEFVKNKVWVDTNNDGSWAVYRKGINYSYDSELIKSGSTTFGSAVAYNDNLGYLVSDADAGEVYRYIFNELFNVYELNQTITGDASFGTTIAYSNDIYVISQPTGATTADRTINIYQLVISLTENELQFLQTIEAPDSAITDWGTSVAISGDTNWLYISTNVGDVYVYNLSTITGDYEYSNIIASPNNITAGGFDLGTEYKITSLGTTTQLQWNVIAGTSAITYAVNDVFTCAHVGTGFGTGTAYPTGDNFGYSITTDYYGDTVVSSSPNQNYNSSTTDWGYTYVFDRTVQNFEAPYSSQPFVPQTFALAWTPTTVTQTATATASSTDRITVTSSTGFSVGDPVVFSGTLLSAGAIAADTVYYVYDKPTSTTFRIAATRDALAPIDLATSTGSMTCTIQTTPLLVSVNGTALTDNNYAVIGSTFYVYSSLTAGDIINVSSNNFVLTQTLTTETTPRSNVQFGKSVDTNVHATEIIVGAPFELGSQNQQGAVYRYTNGGGKYGMIIGTNTCAITTSRTILINGYIVTLSAGSVETTVAEINSANITNVLATAQTDALGNITGNLIIYLIDTQLASVNDKLNVTVLDTATWAELGFNTYTQTQVINDPHTQSTTQFGNNVKFNEFDSFVVSAPTATRYEATTFDSTDDENYDNDTLFDNNATQWVDTYRNAGAVYMYDYLSVYNESLNNVGNFTYAQSVNDINEEYGNQPMYGHALDYNQSHVVVGTPNFRPGYVNGQVVTYINTIGTPDWSVYRNSNPVVDTGRIQDIQLYSALTNNTLDNLDYIDPLQGKLLGSVRQNIDVVSNVDPAGYNSPNAPKGTMVWGATQVGQTWFNTSTTRFVNYHQNDIVYNSKWWGQVFPGSDVKVYSWITSNVPPVSYTGPGTVFDIDSYAVEYILNATGVLTPVYFYWVRNTNIVFTKTGKTLSDNIIQSYIASPINSGISYLAPLQQNIFALYNSGEYINGTDTVLHIGFGTGTNDDVSHSQYSLIRSNYADDFLPGLPGTGSVEIPESLYDRMLDSLCGVDESGGVVPDPYLPKPVQYGIYARPRQSFFVNRFLALQNYLTYANEVLSQYPIAETRRSLFLNIEGSTNPSTVDNLNWAGSTLPFYNTADPAYWSYVNWWATGYDNNTKSALQVPTYADLSTVDASAGLIVTVATNGDGKSETYVYTNLGTWDRIGLQDGTIQFNSTLWDYQTARLGFGDNFFDTTPYDSYPSQETRNIVRALNEEIYTNELLIYRNKSLILLFEFIQSETIESQNYLPWLNKTSFVDVAHTIRELRPIEVFQSDNQDFLAGYINEVKPYHVVIKEFLFKYTGTDVFEGDITDFDLPAQYNASVEQFITPELVYANPSAANQYLPTDPIWQTNAYSQWYNNYGLSITGVNDYQITVLSSYIPLSISAFTVDNAYGFPINGTVLIGEELIGYSIVDRATNTISGLTRGVNGTTISAHVPGEIITINLPAVLLLDGGRGYSEPPKITAYIDTTIYPAPRRQAVLQAVMSLDSILSVNVIDPGDGYAVLPEILIDSSITVPFASTDVNLFSNTIILPSPLLQTGDLVTYTVGANTTSVGGLTVNQYYYVNVLETSPAVVVALYTNYADALNDHDRVALVDIGSGTNNALNVSARASCVSTSIPVRENIMTLRFDRTSYSSQVTDWQAGAFYGSFYAGLYNNSERISSSSITLYDTQPPIDTILASAQGATFEIEDVVNDQVLTWSSRTRIVSSINTGTNLLTITASEGGASLINNQTDPTIGFYIGMPVKFEGAVTGNITVGTTYYIKTLVDGNKFTLSATISGGVPGTVVSMSGTTVGSAGLTCYVGEVTNTAVVTLFYPGIVTATATTATSNIITIPLTGSGLGGTSGFYPNLPIFFTGNVFGGVVENDTYYVTSVIDDETFTMSSTENALTIDITSTASSGNLITCEGTAGLSVNDPIIFSNTVVETGSTNIVEGTIYFIKTVNSTSQFTISETVDGPAFNPGTSTLSMNGVDQKNTLQLTTSTGSMTCNVGLPVSPGQITGQQFTFYPTSSTITDPAFTEGDLIERTIAKSLADGDYLSISSGSGGITNIYNNMPIRVSTSYGGLSTGTTYYVVDTGTVTTEVTETTAGNVLIATSTSGFYAEMPITFTGTTLGGVIANTLYFVKTVDVNGTDFTISDAPGGAELDLTADSGSMTATGEPYIKVSATLGGSVFALTNSSGTTSTTLTQYPTSSPAFDISWILGGYRVAINAISATNIVIGDTYSIASLGTTDWNTVAGTSAITYAVGDVVKVVAVGTGTGTVNAIGYAVNNTFTILGADLDGVTPTNNLVMTVNTVGTNGEITSLICSGTPAETVEKYYLKVISASECEVYSDSLMQIPVSGIDFPYTTGDYALLPEPFYFNQSIVKYNNRVYQCIISNNDTEFIFGKWELLSSDSRKLNALDRIIGYYQPTVNMPGVDLTQLVEGITYPNSTYFGNAFAPADEYTIDTDLQDQVFNPTAVDTTAIVWNGSSYIATANTPTYSDVTNSDDGVTWLSNKITNQPVALTDIVYSGTKYVMSSQNMSTPIYTSDDGLSWTTTGLDSNTVSIASTSLNSVAYYNGIYVAAGATIVRSTDTYNWTETYRFTSVVLNSVTAVTVPNFNGFIAVGYGPDYSNIPTTIKSMVLSSLDGIIWNDVTPSGSVQPLSAITSSNTLIVIMGENGAIFTSINGSNWTNVSTGTTDFTDAAYSIDLDLYVAVGNNGIILSSSDGATWTTRTSGTTENLNSVIWNSDLAEFIITGDNNVILHSVDGTTWTSTNIFVTEPTVYDVQGDSFTAGYGPEELLPGVVTDSLTMIVTTRPGTNWDAEVYAHVGYNVVSVEFATMSGQTTFSFADITQSPAQISVFQVDSATGLATRLYPTSYSINWITKTVELNSSIPEGDSIIIDVYEVGNGDQLEKSNSQTDPIRLNTTTGFNEIYLNCNYSATRTDGSGVIRPGTEPLNTTATETDATDDTILCDHVDHLSVNSQITFEGNTLGGLVENTHYYVKTVSTATNKITVSETLVGGSAGPTFALTTDSGSMEVLIQVGTGLVWTDPIVYNNGEKLLLGATTRVTVTSSSGNTITCNSTATMEVNDPIVFSDTIFGGVIVPQTVYYIKTIIDDNDITISETPGGTTITLTDAVGGAIAITNDYAIGLADNGISAKLIFAAQYDDTADYINYTVFGETYPDQYGYTIPELETFVADGITSVFDLSNYVSGDNPDNAIVELNGVRLLDTEYTISAIANTLTVSASLVAGDVIAITSYNLTERQYFNTQYDITGATVSAISYINNATSPVRVTTATNHGLTTDDVVRIDGVLGSVQLNNNTYYVDVISTTQFDLYYSPVIDNDPVVSVSAYTSGGYVWLDETFTVINSFSLDQDNVDRLWVTINGYRVPSSSLRLNANNNLSILSPITTGDSITITSMMPSATPSQEVYLQKVNKSGTQTIYRANTQTRTWLTQPLYNTDETIYVNDVTRLTDTIVQNVTSPAAVNGIISIGLTADKNSISQVIVYNTTTSSYVDSANYYVQIIDIAPTLQITDEVTAGDSLIITTIEGNSLYVNGEQIKFTIVDLATNTLSGLQRGTNGTGTQTYIPLYSEVFGILPNNLMSSVDYTETWNSYVYNPTEGDPLQISDTAPAIFLNTDIS